MLGQKVLRSKGSYQFVLEDYVPQDHLLRQINEIVDFSFVRRLTARFYSSTGQPGVDPVVLVKMALLGYLYGLTSERRLAEEIQLNLAFRWFLGYDSDEKTPDHSVLSKARKRFGITVYQAFFTEIVRQCQRAGLIVGDHIYVDSTVVRANASRGSPRSRALLSQVRSPAEHVTAVWRTNPAPLPDADGAQFLDEQTDDADGREPAPKGAARAQGDPAETLRPHLAPICAGQTILPLLSVHGPTISRSVGPIPTRLCSAARECLWPSITKSISPLMAGSHV